MNVKQQELTLNVDCVQLNTDKIFMVFAATVTAATIIEGLLTDVKVTHKCQSHT